MSRLRWVMLADREVLGCDFRESGVYVCILVLGLLVGCVSLFSGWDD